jgi:hypothetical protein
MGVAPVPGAVTIAGHRVVGVDRAGGLLSLTVALHGGALIEWARALAKLDGVRVTSGPGGLGRDRCFLVTCPGFKLVVSTPDGQSTDTALALVSRAPQAALTVISELGAVLEQLMTVPPPVVEPVATAAPKTTFFQRRSSLGPGKPLTQRTPLARSAPLQRRTPLARGRWH